MSQTFFTFYLYNQYLAHLKIYLSSVHWILLYLPWCIHCPSRSSWQIPNKETAMNWYLDFSLFLTEMMWFPLSFPPILATAPTNFFPRCPNYVILRVVLYRHPCIRLLLLNSINITATSIPIYSFRSLPTCRTCFYALVP